MKFVDLFAGLGGFHYALQSVGGQCVFASEADDELRRIYAMNHGVDTQLLGAKIQDVWEAVPEHDVLCAGFPCQPFSKSGSQAGLNDVTRGTLFDYVLKIAKKRKPRLILLENVGNFERHDSGNTWKVIRAKLNALEYSVAGTEHLKAGGSGLISPHHFGFPQVRERFFAVASLKGFKRDPLPARPKEIDRESLYSIIQDGSDFSKIDQAECELTLQQVSCIDHWNRFIQSIPKSVDLPGFPIWADEFHAKYPARRYLTRMTRAELQAVAGKYSKKDLPRDELLNTFPSYMRNGEGSIPEWKVRFIEQNRAFYQSVKKYLPHSWLDELQQFPPSLRKLEWNCQGEERNVWTFVLQFRPSGLRVKRFNAAPALVSMTVTQIPILGPQRRFLSRVEGKRLQGFPDNLELPGPRSKAFQALGNAVHVKVARRVAATALSAI
jgi:DNA (cytosine-5)-methyltransferase 1